MTSTTLQSNHMATIAGKRVPLLDSTKLADLPEGKHLKLVNEARLQAYGRTRKWSEK